MNKVIETVTLTKKGGTKEFQVRRYDDGALVFDDVRGNRLRVDSCLGMEKFFEVLRGL